MWLLAQQVASSSQSEQPPQPAAGAARASGVQSCPGFCPASSFPHSACPFAASFDLRHCKAHPPTDSVSPFEHGSSGNGRRRQRSISRSFGAFFEERCYRAQPQAPRALQRRRVCRDVPREEQEGEGRTRRKDSDARNERKKRKAAVAKKRHSVACCSFR